MNARTKSNTIPRVMQDVISSNSELIEGINRIGTLAKKTDNGELLENINELKTLAKKTGGELLESVILIGTTTKKIVGIEEACMIYSLGKASMRKVVEDANAAIRIGTRHLVNCEKVDLYMNSISE